MITFLWEFTLDDNISMGVHIEVYDFQISGSLTLSEVYKNLHQVISVLSTLIFFSFLRKYKRLFLITCRGFQECIDNDSKQVVTV